MAPQSKKNSKSSPKKKSPAKRVAVKKKRMKKKKSTSKLKKGFFIFIGLLFIVSLVSFSYYLNKETKDEASVKSKISKSLPKITKKEVKVKRHKKVVKKPKIITASNVDNVTFVPYKNSKPKLVIIIDDVHTKAQVVSIKALPVKVTPSIFPPYKLAPNSNRLAYGLKHYMIHLPMESRNKKFNTQYKTLKVSFSNKKIENRIKELRLLFPKAKFINNHTGSVFTSDYAAMHLAYKSMRENGFIFLDSKTKNTSKVKEIAHSYGDVYVARDIFIDNDHSISAIHAQLKKAVKIARKKGYAIAIGHPHSVTMQALASSKEILKEVELVYIDELYK